MFWSIFFQNSPFQTKYDFVRIFSRNIYSTDFCQYLLSSFLEKSRFKKFLLFFNSRIKIFWSRVQPVKNFQGFCWGQNFVLFTSQTWRDNSNIFKQVFFALCLLIDEESLRQKNGRKKYQIIIKKTYDSKGKKCFILESKNKTTWSHVQ